MARLFVNNLTVMDFSFLDVERGLVGESWIVDVELIGDLDDQGMVFDFGDVKKQIKRFFDAQADHRLLVPVRSPGCRIQEDNDRLSVEFPLNSGAIVSHQSPPDTVLLVDSQAIVPDQIAQQLQRQLKTLLPGNVSNLFIGLRPEKIDGPYYHYTHGLQQHLGQCQRIAHGHRSRIEIYIDDERSQQLEQHWASRLADSYIATKSHVVEELDCNGIPHTRLAYTAQQGEFAVSVPSSQVLLIPYVSTVENIARYLAETIAQQQSGQVTVRAFEGVEKGAVAEAGSD
ncbi:6-pyruvoyl tetrahydropterin reductase [Motiliproteus coralliicola]|uniref:6-carboxy-5,6,7,8-tetrahydropterin synthase n=1 Tax=Motiliproteus coralliicola TaxID=2283196 RepID=A0A369WBK5_9GAMM|nr:6-carboxytetrahydropterin synthase [Motiliproteus coralliicola]RDE19380.1 6-pyruvoyl tetrahydropterin reductase [Motiliproteus coralliicola]